MIALLLSVVIPNLIGPSASAAGQLVSNTQVPPQSEQFSRLDWQVDEVLLEAVALLQDWPFNELFLQVSAIDPLANKRIWVTHSVHLPTKRKVCSILV